MSHTLARLHDRKQRNGPAVGCPREAEGAQLARMRLRQGPRAATCPVEEVGVPWAQLVACGRDRAHVPLPALSRSWECRMIGL